MLLRSNIPMSMSSKMSAAFTLSSGLIWANSAQSILAWTAQFMRWDPTRMPKLGQVFLQITIKLTCSQAVSSSLESTLKHSGQ